MPQRLSIVILVFLSLLIWNSSVVAQKPKVWIITDGSDKNIKGENFFGTVSDPDDISAIAGYLLMSNMFDTRAIVVASHKRNFYLMKAPDQKKWADEYFGKAYLDDLPMLNKHIGGYQERINFMESCLKKLGEEFDPDNSYKSLENYSTVQALLEEAEKNDGIINVLCWGILTEPAILVKHCLGAGRYDVLVKLRFISHWTNSSFRGGTLENPESVHNCFNDADACAYMKLMALNGHIKFYECGGIGQYGIVDGSPKGLAYYDQFNICSLGKIFREGKCTNHLQKVDDSDAATYWVLLGNWGVSLKDMANNGTNKPEVEQRNEKAFFEWAPLIREEMLRRANLAGAKSESIP